MMLVVLHEKITSPMQLVNLFEVKMIEWIENVRAKVDPLTSWTNAS